MGIYYEIVPSVLSVVKFFVSRTTLKKRVGNNIRIVHAIATFVVIIAIIILFVPWYVLRKFLEFALKLHHGENYGGMLNGPDRTLEMYTPKPLIIFVYILEHDGTIQELYTDIKTACANLYNSDMKFSSIIKKTLGYHYYVGNQIKVDEIISIEEWSQDFVSKDDLNEYFDNKYLNYEHESGDKKLWEIVIFNKPMYNRNLQGKCCYPVVIRTSHSISDGIHLSVFHQKYLMSRFNDEPFIHAVKSKKNMFSLKHAYNVGKYFTRTVPHYDLNVQNRNKISSLYMEDYPKYWNIIKEIRREANVTFTDVFVTAAACSLRDYFKNNNVKIDKMLFGATCRPVTENIDDVLSGTLLTNGTTFTTDMLNISTRDIPISGLLMEYAETLNNSKNSSDSQVIYLMQKLGEYVPHIIFKTVHDFLVKPVVFGLTNIPSIESGYIGNHYIKDAFIYVNSFNNTRFMFQILTYNGRLQVNVTVEEDTVNSREEIDKILVNTFANIDKLHKEVINR